MKIVLDTNIFISGLISASSISSPNGKIIKAWRNEHLNIVISEPIIEEIKKVLHYPKIAKRLKWSELEILNFTSTLRFKCDMVDISKVKVSVPKDQNDKHILATFVKSKADFLISGDDDLLSLKSKYKIITPSEFEKIFL